MIVQPGAPGQATRVIGADQASDLSQVQHTPADVKFMQGMIGHHAQAIEMTALLPSRTTREDMKMLGLRISLSQDDEIKMMRHWLEVRGAPLPSEHAHHTPGGTDARDAHARGDGAASRPPGVPRSTSSFSRA